MLLCICIDLLPQLLLLLHCYYGYNYTAMLLLLLLLLLLPVFPIQGLSILKPTLSKINKKAELTPVLARDKGRQPGD